MMVDVVRIWLVVVVWWRIERAFRMNYFLIVSIVCLVLFKVVGMPCFMNDKMAA